MPRGPHCSASPWQVAAREGHGVPAESQSPHKHRVTRAGFFIPFTGLTTLPAPALLWPPSGPDKELFLLSTPPPQACPVC